MTTAPPPPLGLAVSLQVERTQMSLYLCLMGSEWPGLSMFGQKLRDVVSFQPVCQTYIHRLENRIPQVQMAHSWTRSFCPPGSGQEASWCKRVRSRVAAYGSRGKGERCRSLFCRGEASSEHLNVLIFTFKLTLAGRHSRRSKNTAADRERVSKVADGIRWDESLRKSPAMSSRSEGELL